MESGVCVVEVLEAGQLVVAALRLAHDVAHLAAPDAQAAEHGRQLVVVSVPASGVGTTAMIRQYSDMIEEREGHEGMRV
jgi:hypothetical protein